MVWVSIIPATLPSLKKNKNERIKKLPEVEESDKNFAIMRPAVKGQRKSSYFLTQAAKSLSIT